MAVDHSSRDLCLVSGILQYSLTVASHSNREGMPTHVPNLAYRSYLITSSNAARRRSSTRVGGVTAACRFRHELPISSSSGHRYSASFDTPSTRTFTSTRSNMVKPTEEVIQDFNGELVDVDGCGQVRYGRLIGRGTG